jgi:hypothetical protein
MYSEQEHKFIHLDEHLAAKFDDPTAKLTEHQKIQREWTRFAEGETVEVKGVHFRIHEIGETRLILKPIDKAAFAAKTVSA